MASQITSNTENKKVLWSVNLRPKVGQSVTYLGNEWISLSGINSEPSLTNSDDWLLISQGKRTKKPISTATYTFEAADVNKYIEFSAECVATVPDGFPADLEFQGEQVGTGALTFEATTTLNVFSGFLKETAGQNAVFGIRTKGSDIATITGTLKLA